MVSNPLYFVDVGPPDEIFENENDKAVISPNEESTIQSLPCISIKEAYDSLCKLESKHGKTKGRKGSKSKSSKGKIKGKYTCDKCKRSYTFRHDLVYHQNYDCGQNPKMECPYCDYKAEKSFNVHRHIKTRHPNEVIDHIDTRKVAKTPCQKENSTPFFRGASNPETWKFFCNNCSRGFPNKSALIKHIMYVCCKPDRTYACPYCEYRGQKSSNVKNHIRRIHKDEEVLFIKLDYDANYKVENNY